VSGPTGCGKTNFVLRLVDNVDTMIDPTTDKIVYYFVEYRPLFDDYDARVDFRHGLPKAGEIEKLGNALVVLDDMMAEVNEKVPNVFTRGSHHRNISIVFMVQNVSNKNKHMRTISLNAQYILFFKNPRENRKFAHLAKQLYPHNSRYAQDAYTDATTQPYGYLLLDLRSKQDEELRLRTTIFSRRATDSVRAKMMHKVANDLPVPKRIARTHVKAKRDYLKRCEICFDKRMQHIIM